MSDLNEKFNNFTSLVLNDAQHKRDEILEKIHHEHDEIINGKENEFLEEAYHTIQQGVSEAHRAASSRILHAELDAKKQLLVTREKIIDEVFEAVIEKLNKYIKTDAYAEWLLKKITLACNEAGEGKKTIYVANNDIKLKDKIVAIDPENISVEATDDNGFIGGVKVFNPNRHISVDYSFKEMLEDEKNSFIQKSGLIVD